MDELGREFLEEAEQMLRELDVALRDLEAGGGDEPVSRAYRAVHVIRGGAGFLGLERVERLAAAAEELFSRPCDPATADLGREVWTALSAVLAAVGRTGTEPEGDDAPLIARVFEG